MRNSFTKALVAVPTAAVITLSAFGPALAADATAGPATECAPGFALDASGEVCVLAPVEVESPAAGEETVPVQEPEAELPETSAPGGDPAPDQPETELPEAQQPPAPEDEQEQAPGVDTVGTPGEIDAVFDGINAAREAAGLDPVTFNIKLSKANQTFLNDFLVNWTDSTVDPYAGTQIGWSEASLSMGYSHQGGLEGVLEAVEGVVAEETSALYAAGTTYVGIAVAHPGNPGVDEQTGQNIPGTYITASFFDYPAAQKLPGSYADAADAYAGYTPTATSPFRDVSTSHVFYKQMSWLAESGISKGWSSADGTKSYRPSAAVDRDVMAAFLYRWNGSPEVDGADVTRFRDVTAGHAFAKEMNWLANQSISTGWQNADGTRSYRPHQAISRDQMAAFLYRMAGSPEYTAPATSPFTDVPTTHVFYKEMAWLAETGVSTGWQNADGTRSYKPDSPILREQMAAFLYRLAAVN